MMTTLLITAGIRITLWLVLFIAALWKRYPEFAVIGFVGIVANAANGLAAIDSHNLSLWLNVGGCAGVILIGLIVRYALEGMKVRDKLRHPLTAEDLHLK